jgi:hypothetical protein
MGSLRDCSPVIFAITSANSIIIDISVISLTKILATLGWHNTSVNFDEEHSFYLPT